MADLAHSIRGRSLIIERRKNLRSGSPGRTAIPTAWLIAEAAGRRCGVRIPWTGQVDPVVPFGHIQGLVYGLVTSGRKSDKNDQSSRFSFRAESLRRSDPRI